MRTFCYPPTVDFEYDSQKDARLRESRGVGFSDAIEAIEAGRVLLEFDHPNQTHYPDQKMFVLQINRYAYCVPYLRRGQTHVLKTVYPSRKFKHLVEEEPNG